MSRYYVGLDVHWTHTTVCVLDRHGKRVKRLTIRGAWSQIVDELKQLSGKVSVCFEASTAYGHLYELISKVANRVVVAHPGQLRLIFRSKKKNDRTDAEKLAKLLFLGEVPVVYVPSQNVRAWRQLVVKRKSAGPAIGTPTPISNQPKSIPTITRKQNWSVICTYLVDVE